MHPRTARDVVAHGRDERTFEEVRDAANRSEHHAKVNTLCVRVQGAQIFHLGRAMLSVSVRHGAHGHLAKITTVSIVSLETESVIAVDSSECCTIFLCVNVCVCVCVC